MSKSKVEIGPLRRAYYNEGWYYKGSMEVCCSRRINDLYKVDPNDKIWLCISTRKVKDAFQSTVNVGFSISTAVSETMNALGFIDPYLEDESNEEDDRKLDTPIWWWVEVER